MDGSFNDKYKHDLIIAVDYDDTITEKRPYPIIAPLNKTAKKYLDRLHIAGFTIVLWTARVGEDYTFALNRCKTDFGMSYIQSDGPEFKHGFTGKIWANFFIDDHGYINGKVP